MPARGRRRRQGAPGRSGRTPAGGRTEEVAVHPSVAPAPPSPAESPAPTPPVSAPPAVEVVDLQRRYGDFEAVRGVSFEVRPGEVFALLGVNGAGKTSALDVLEGLAPASAGSVRVLGADPRRERASHPPRAQGGTRDGATAGARRGSAGVDASPGRCRGGWCRRRAGPRRRW
ncbi:ATP-binding cassette domain-containing protein [Geodermatophilus sp. URMC 61]|uniref:ATP-binding cassette domain-containing protein n=1 Tax=Geodermatophilus sp. URMC 61 TaxID=3423411 RepID=UPI00406CE9B1